MSAKYFLTCVWFISCTLALSQNKYGLKALALEDYIRSVKFKPENELIDLESVVSDLKLDIRYATDNNFMHRKMYSMPRAFTRKPVAEALQKAQAEFKKLGWGIEVYDAYRPYAVTVQFYEAYRDTTYVASPFKGSRHNRGCAIDMTVVQLASGQELKMPTGFDSFSKDAWPTTPAKDSEAGKNRTKLIEVMEANGFKVNTSEWWHFDFVGWQRFDVLDVAFEELDKLN